jgi:hypothetical protein
MRSPLQVRTDELEMAFAERAGGTGRSVYDVVTLQPGAIFPPQSGYTLPTSSLPPAEAEIHRHLTWITSLYSGMLDDECDDRTAAEDLATRWAASFHGLAQELRRNPKARKHSEYITAVRLINDMQDDVIKAAMGAGLTSQQFVEWSRDHVQDDLTRLPYLGTMYAATHTRLRNASDTWNSHDLADMFYLAGASAYTDIVVCEKKGCRLPDQCLARSVRRRTAGDLAVRPRRTTARTTRISLTMEPRQSECAGDAQGWSNMRSGPIRSASVTPG